MTRTAADALRFWRAAAANPRLAPDAGLHIPASDLRAIFAELDRWQKQGAARGIDAEPTNE